MKTSPCLRGLLQIPRKAFLREENLQKLKLQVLHG
jgi:hypothetical protein